MQSLIAYSLIVAAYARDLRVAGKWLILYCLRAGIISNFYIQIYSGS